MATIKQKWARERNCLLRRLRGAAAVMDPANRFLPDLTTASNLSIAESRLNLVIKKFEQINTYEKYQRYLKQLR